MDPAALIPTTGLLLLLALVGGIILAVPAV